ncbi:MAG: TetR/AcrR family transcriptional regulator [Persicimonas sp.]
MARKSSRERREEITEALLRTMARHGYAKATIARIAEEADLNPGLIHYHFASKQEILLELIGHLVGQQGAAVADSLAEAGGPVEKLRLLIDAMLATGETADSDAVAAWVAITAESIRQAEVREAFEEALDALVRVLEAVIAEGCVEGVFEPADGLSEAACATALMATVQGYLTVSGSAPDLIPEGSAAGATWQMARGLLGIDAEEEACHA